MNGNNEVAPICAASPSPSSMLNTGSDTGASTATISNGDSQALRQRLLDLGLLPDDPRFQTIFHGPSSSPRTHTGDAPIAFDNERVEAFLNGGIAIPEWGKFVEGVKKIFDQVSDGEYGGKVASYIPQLASVDPAIFAISFCSIDGQRFNLGDSSVSFCLQSCIKPISYSIALDEIGATIVHKHIGREPSGKSFNHMSLLDRKLPHNPMINAGAIMSSSLIQRGLPSYKRFSKVQEVCTKLCGGKKISFDNGVYLSEKGSADRNYALGFMMKEAGAFPQGTNLTDTLEFYFQQCSLEADTDRMAIMAATYANGGVCPLTGETVFQPSTVRNTLSLMATCGMYDYSGEWNFRVGLPAKSGVSGAIWVVVPDVGGFCLYSPPVDSFGNSKKGLEFFKAVSDAFALHTLEPRRCRMLRQSSASSF
ncbi:glutaminase-domain-containing protein [Chytriomyces sp. MP71]|nr:glutaminase-domain-containing protein [Chytriomyces sp. MP71]